MLPHLNGIEICRRIRVVKETPIIMLTARDSVMDRVMGLDGGADDYMSKPFSIEELLARMRVIFRRNERHEENIVKHLIFKEIEVDTISRTVKKGEEEIPLTKREYELLLMFLQNVNRVLSRELILEKIWGYETEVETNVVDVYVRYLRNKINKENDNLYPLCSWNWVCDEMMKKLKLKSKIVLWATVLMIGLFVSYNILQYFVMNSWMIHYEEQSIEKKMTAIQNYYSNQKLSVQFIKENESFINSINEKSETIRILDKEGKSIVAVSEEELLHVPSQLVQSEQFELVKSGDDRLLVYREPLVDTNYVGTIEIVRNMEIFDGLLEQFSLVMFLTGIGAVFLSLVGALFLSKQIVRPIQAISHSLTRIKKFGLEERVKVPPAQDEISELAIHFNELMDQLETSFNQQKQFVEDASHELRTPLSVLNGNLMMLNRWGKDDREVLNKSLVSSLREVDRMDKLVKDLLELSRLDSEKTVDATIPMINPINVIEKVVNDFEMTHPEFMFSLQLFDGTLLPMKEQHLEQLLTILIDNAIKYSNDDKRVTIHYQHRELTIQDFGIGIPKEDVLHVTDRFYRVEKSRNRKKGGYGIGLSIALKLMEAYKGSLVIESQLGKGTSVKLVFPKTKNTK